MTTPRPPIARTIRRLRAERQWSQAELARRAGLARITIAQIEGGTRVPELESRKRLARAFGVPITDLLN
jgi:transcriptional regulator with XRE-family HTH domain